MAISYILSVLIHAVYFRMLFIHLILTTLAYTVGDIYTGDISLPLFKIADFSPIILKKQFSEKLHQEISSGKLDNFPSVSTFSWNWLLLTLVRMCRLQIMVAQNEMIDLISIYDQIKVRVRLERTWLASQVMAGWTWLMDSTRQFDFIYTGAMCNHLFWAHIISHRTQPIPERPLKSEQQSCYNYSKKGLQVRMTGPVLERVISSTFWL